MSVMEKNSKLSKNGCDDALLNYIYYILYNIIYYIIILPSRSASIIVSHIIYFYTIL